MHVKLVSRCALVSLVVLLIMHCQLVKLHVVPLFEQIKKEGRMIEVLTIEMPILALTKQNRLEYSR